MFKNKKIGGSSRAGFSGIFLLLPYRKTRSPYSFMMAYRTFAWLFETVPFFKDETAFPAFRRSNNQQAMNAAQAPPDMLKVLIGFLFGDTDL